jgi:hypothetical protein
MSAAGSSTHNKKPDKCPDESTINENYELSGPDAELELGIPPQQLIQ